MKSICILTEGGKKYCGGHFSENEQSATLQEAVDVWKNFPSDEAERERWRANPESWFPCNKCIGAAFKASGIQPKRLEIHLKPEAAILHIDPKRLGKQGTGIYIRAKHEGRWGSYDIYDLTKESLLSWLRSRGGKNEWAESVVGTLLRHENLHGDGA